MVHLYVNPTVKIRIVNLVKSREGLSRAEWANLFVSVVGETSSAMSQRGLTGPLQRMR